MSPPEPAWFTQARPRLVAMRVGEVVIIDTHASRFVLARHLRKLPGKWASKSVEGGYKMTRKSLC